MKEKLVVEVKTYENRLGQLKNQLNDEKKDS
jgi:hypothetical protein